MPTGGTEKNGYHMVMGKHNFIVAHAANLMARRLKNALVAPMIQYVPEGDPDRQNPGAISLPSPAYDMLLDAAARSLKAHGFNEILFIGDSGGNQAGHARRRREAERRVEGRAASKVFALTDYYEGGREHYRAWMEAAFGYDDDDRRQPRRHQRHVADAARAARPACARIRSSRGADRRIPACRAIR